MPGPRPSLALRGHPETRAIARRRVCPRRWLRPSHPARPESNRELHAGTRHPSFHAKLFLQWVEPVQRQVALFLYCSNKYKSRPQRGPLACFYGRDLEAIAAEARERPEIFVVKLQSIARLAFSARAANDPGAASMARSKILSAVSKFLVA